MRSLPAEALSALRCPICRAPLQCDDDACVCAACAERFPIVDGIPILINEANSLFSREDFTRRRVTTAPLHETRWKKRLKGLLPGLSKNYVARQNYARLSQLLAQAQPADGASLVLVVGAGNLGQGLDALLDQPHIRLVETDVSFGRRIALIADAHDIPFADGAFDGVIIQAVLEHVLDPQRCVAEIHRVLKPAGLVYAETPFMQQVHEGRYDFTRFTHLGHRRLFRYFAEIDSGPVAGPGMALGWAWAYFLMGFVDSKGARSFLYTLARLTAWPWKYFDRLLLKRPGVYDAASGYFFLGRRAEEPLNDRELVGQYRGGM